MSLSINLTRRVRHRKLKSGERIEQVRYVLNLRDPRTGSREQRFFERQREAQERRAELIAEYERGIYSSAPSKPLTVVEAVSVWLESKRGPVRPITLATYEFQAGYVAGPLPPAEARRAVVLSGVGARPEAKPIALLGGEKARELTTRRIRAWRRLVTEEVSLRAANKGIIILKAALARCRGPRVPPAHHAHGPPAAARQGAQGCADF